MRKTEIVWAELMAQLGLPKRRWLPVWRQIEESYSAPNRRYHTLVHIDYFLRGIDRFGAHLLMPSAVRLAAIFHDVKDAEEESVEFARRVLSDLGVPASWISAVCELVLCTKGHRPLEGLLAYDSAVLSDCDLLILSTPQRQYDAYTRKIRFEYKHYDDAKFRAGRKAVLESFSKRDPIYFSPEIHARYEQKALANLKRELAALS